MKTIRIVGNVDPVLHHNARITAEIKGTNLVISAEEKASCELVRIRKVKGMIEIDVIPYNETFCVEVK